MLLGTFGPGDSEAFGGISVRGLSLTRYLRIYDSRFVSSIRRLLLLDGSFSPDISVDFYSSELLSDAYSYV